MKRYLSFLLALLLLLPGCGPGTEEEDLLPNPTRKEIKTFQKDLEQQLQYISDHRDQIERMEIIYHEDTLLNPDDSEPETKQITFTTTDPQLLSQWIACLQKVELDYVPYERYMGHPHTLSFVVGQQTVELGYGWESGCVKKAGNLTVMAKIKNDSEFSDEYDALIEQMQKTESVV